MRAVKPRAAWGEARLAAVRTFAGQNEDSAHVLAAAGGEAAKADVASLVDMLARQEPRVAEVFDKFAGLQDALAEAEWQAGWDILGTLCGLNDAIAGMERGRRSSLG